MNIQGNIKKDILLKKYTTFKIGGPADFFISVHNIDELKEALRYAKENKLKVFILGGGSNIVFNDNGFRGLVIKIEIRGIICRDTAEGDILLQVGAGEVWDELVLFCVSQGFYGIENLSAIPGTVGATPVQNIGAYGVEVKDTIESVEAIEMKTCKVKVFTKKECIFGYRNSFFKTTNGKKYIITRVSFKLKKNGVPQISYVDLVNYFSKNKNNDIVPSLKEIRKAILSIRNKKFPNLSEVGTAGSFFKNPIISNKEFKVLQEKFPDIPAYYSDRGHVKVPLGFILERLGWRGKEYKQVGTYKKQALVIVNNKHATQKQLEVFAQMIERDVKNKTDIIIEREVTLVK